MPSARATIFALATPPGRSGLAVMRMSGPKAAGVLSKLSHGRQFAPRQAILSRLYDPKGKLFDQALVLWFAAPASYTGEDMVELHLHGGPAVIEAAAQALLALGAQPAGPGEFTRRAFEHGKLDLVQAEAVADLIDAQTRAQLDQAQRQLSGDLGALYGAWRERLEQIRAQIEACLDFPEEDDVIAAALAPLRPQVRALAAMMQEHLHDNHCGERIRQGLTIALTGPVNAGKSTLLNRLAGEPAAIVSDQPGTTRDIIRVALDLGGYLVELADSAGLRQTSQAVEKEGVVRATALAQAADIRIVVVDGSAGKPLEDIPAELVQEGDFLVLNKSDLGAHTGPMDTDFPGTVMSLSAREGAGVEVFVQALQQRVTALLSARDAPALTRARHRLALSDCVRALERAAMQLPGQAELAGEDLREAGAALGQITGECGTEDILGRIFSHFCIGK